MSRDIIDEQREVCKKYKSPISPCQEEDFLGVALSSLEKSPIYGVRLEPNGQSCGWYIWAGEHSDAVDFYSSMHVAHIFEIIPIVEKYLSLAPGFKFIIDRDGYEDVWQELN